MSTRIERRGDFFRDEEGPTAVEYAVMLALIIASAIASINLLGGASQAFWQRSVDRVQEAAD